MKLKIMCSMSRFLVAQYGQDGKYWGRIMDENKPEVRSRIDQIYSAVMADTEALEDAKMTLEIIKRTDPGVYDEMIDETLVLIRAALNTSILGIIEKLQKFKKLSEDDYKEIWIKVMVDTKGMTYLPIYEFAKAIESKIVEKNK